MATMKLQVNVSIDMVKIIDSYADLIGVSRSSLCAMFIGQGALSLQKGLEASENYFIDASKKELEKKKK